jgi:AraC-like DNA-binding protein
MPLWQWSPPPALAPWLRGLAASSDDGAPEPVRVLPDGGVDLLFSARAAGGAWTGEVFGAKSTALVVADAEPMEKLAVRLAPGAARGWLGVAAHTLSDRALPLDALWGRAARELGARLAEARGRGERRAALEAALLARAGSAEAPPAWLGAALAALGRSADVRAVARALGVSERRLERAFRAHVGLGPKRFARVARLARARRAVAHGASQLEAALFAGYYDQAHFHRECRALAGVGPAELGVASDSYKPERALAV